MPLTVTQLKGAIFSRRSQDWATPDDVYRTLDQEFSFTLDPCPLGDGGIEGLLTPWAGHRVYCNPPYGRGVERWLDKALEADVAVYLLPARTDTAWWHKYGPLASEIRFIRGRLKFGGAQYNAPFPSVVLVYRADDKEETPDEE